MLVYSSVTGVFVGNSVVGVSVRGTGVGEAVDVDSLGVWVGDGHAVGDDVLVAVGETGEVSRTGSGVSVSLRSLLDAQPAMNITGRINNARTNLNDFM